MALHHIEDCTVGIFKNTDIAQQAAWGTADADTLDALELNVRSFVIDEDIQLRESDPALTGTREDDILNHYNDTKNASPNFTIETPGGVLKDELAYYLMAHFQNVTEGETTPFQKTFTYHATQPDFASDEGYFATFCFRSPEASQSLIAADCIGAAKLGLKVAPGGFLELTQDWNGRGALSVTGNPSGTWARATVGSDDKYAYEDLSPSIDFGSGAQDVKADILGEVSLELTQTMAKCGIDSGNFATWALSTRKGSFKCQLAMGANARSAEANLRNGTKMTVVLQWNGAGTTDGDLQLTFLVHPTSVKRVSGEGGVFAVEIEGAIVGDSATPTEMITVAMADAQDMGW